MFDNLKPTQQQYVKNYQTFLGFEEESTTKDNALTFISKLMERHLYKVPCDGSNFCIKTTSKIFIK